MPNESGTKQKGVCFSDTSIDIGAWYYFTFLDFSISNVIVEEVTNIG